jgi:hypothetical protein
MPFIIPNSQTGTLIKKIRKSKEISRKLFPSLIASFARIKTKIKKKNKEKERNKELKKLKIRKRMERPQRFICKVINGFDIGSFCAQRKF